MGKAKRKILRRAIVALLKISGGAFHKIELSQI